VLKAMQRLYTRDEYMRRIDWMKSAKRDIAITSDIIVGFPGETEAEFEETMQLLDEVRFDAIYGFKYSQRPNTAALAIAAKVPEEEITRRLTAVLEKQRAIQIRRHGEMIGATEEVLIEGRNHATQQWIGRTAQNRTLNFTHPSDSATLLGSYMPVRITRAGPNSLAGEACM
jgi:tRNA-2-methylthio-N6-dimethylallyladenosine synthase